MLARLLLPFVFCCLSFGCLAQVFEPALLVGSNGDTLRGEVENAFWVEPPTFIRYRPTPDSPSQLFEPRQLQAVVFREGRYFRYEVLPIDHAAQTKLESLLRGNVSRIETDSLLAEVLVEGAATLFRVAWQGVNHYLIEVPGRPLLELSERRYLRENERGGWEVTEGNNYRNQLALFFAACPEANAAVPSEFTVAGLAAVVQAYNRSCSSLRQPGRSWVAQASPRRRVSFQGGLLGGVRYNRIESPTALTLGPCVDCRPHPFAGLYAELFQPSRVTAMYGELSMSTFRGQNSMYLGRDNAGLALYDVSTYRALLGTARLGFRYFFPLPKEQQLLFGFGYELNWVISSTFSDAAGALYAKEQGLDFAPTTLLPNLVLGWRAQRYTLSTDLQFYQNNGDNGLIGSFLGTNFALRAGLAYRLGHNPDANTR